MRPILILGLFLFCACSSVQKMAVRSAAPVFEESTQYLTYEKNWNFFKDSTPGNLKFLEILYLRDQDNLKLLSLLIKGYAGYAYAVPETIYFGEMLSGSEALEWKSETISHYTRALDYGLSYFAKKSITKSDLLSLEESKLRKKLSKNLSEDDLVATLYFAQAWGSLIHWQQDNIALISQVPRVKILFDEVCSRNSKIEYGLCDIFSAQYEASRPQMLGGNPEKAKVLYREAFVKYPKHLLIHLNFIQFLVIPGLDEEVFKKEAKFLEKEFAKFESLNRDNLEDSSEYSKSPEINLFNAIAKKRFDYILKHQKKIF